MMRLSAKGQLAPIGAWALACAWSLGLCFAWYACAWLNGEWRFDFAMANGRSGISEAPSKNAAFSIHHAPIGKAARKYHAIERKLAAAAVAESMWLAAGG